MAPLLRIAAVAVAIVLLAGCAGQSAVTSPSDSAAPSPSARSAPSTTSPSLAPSTFPTPSEAAASPSPTAAALVIPPIEVGDYLEVTGNGLAVRTGPGAEHAIVSEWLRTGSGDGLEVTPVRDEVRLPAGYVVRAELGPLVVDDTAWWAVRNSPQAGEAAVDDTELLWRNADWVPSDEYEFDLTWIAVAQPGTTLVRPTERPAMECPCYGEVPGPVAVASGVGEGRVGPWINEAPPWITFAAAAPSSAETCEFRAVTQAGETFLDKLGAEFFVGVVPGVSLAPDVGAEVWLDIVGDCAWALSVQFPQG